MEIGQSFFRNGPIEQIWPIAAVVVGLILLAVFGNFMRLLGVGFLLVAAGLAYFWWQVGN